MPDRTSLMLDNMITVVDEGFSYDGIVSIPETGLEDVCYQRDLPTWLNDHMHGLRKAMAAFWQARFGRKEYLNDGHTFPQRPSSAQDPPSPPAPPPKQDPPSPPDPPPAQDPSPTRDPHLRRSPPPAQDPSPTQDPPPTQDPRLRPTPPPKQESSAQSPPPTQDLPPTLQVPEQSERVSTAAVWTFPLPLREPDVDQNLLVVRRETRYRSESQFTRETKLSRGGEEEIGPSSSGREEESEEDQAETHVSRRAGGPVDWHWSEETGRWTPTYRSESGEYRNSPET